MFASFSEQLYHLQQWANGLVAQQLNHLSVLSLGVIFLAGLITSLTPCMLSMLPIMVGYIGGYENQGRWQSALQSAWFALGLASTLAALGVGAVAFGRVYGQIGLGLPVVVSAIAIIMGLNLLEIIAIPLPNWGNTDWITADFPRGLRSYLLGLTFGLVASPCSTPVLASLLAWVATQGNFVVGGGFLLAYAIGYVLPLVFAGTFTASIKRFLAFRKWSSWFTPVSGALLVGFGVISLFSRF